MSLKNQLAACGIHQVTDSTTNLPHILRTNPGDHPDSSYMFLDITQHDYVLGSITDATITLTDYDEDTYEPTGRTTYTLEEFPSVLHLALEVSEHITLSV